MPCTPGQQKKSGLACEMTINDLGQVVIMSNQGLGAHWRSERPEEGRRLLVGRRPGPRRLPRGVPTSATSSSST